MGVEVFEREYTYMIVMPDGTFFYPFIITANCEKDAFLHILHNTYNQSIIISVLNYLFRNADITIGYTCNLLANEMINRNITRYQDFRIYKEFIQNHSETISNIFLHFWERKVITIEDYIDTDL
jgi:hypothetical protein